MCGIGGEIAYKDSINLIEDLKTISFEMSHRGPDFQDFVILPKKVGLVHNRLSIIDLSVNGNQPMSNHDKSIYIVFNGEIYNFLDLKKELNSSTYPFITNSDTEVLLAAYEIWGIQKTVAKIRGMFAFALYDTRINKIILSRDYFGKKPLYYFVNKDRFIFSSEIKPLNTLLKKDLTIDYNSIDYFLTELSVNQPNTIWNEIKQIPRNHFLVYDLESQAIDLNENLPLISFQNKSVFSEEEALFTTEELLKKAILKRKMADVPISCFLSGGVDSGLISSIMAKESSEQIKTYTVGFDFDDYNEFDLASIVAKKYNTEHHQINIKSNLLDTIHCILSKQGEPFADSSLIPTYLITKEIGKDVKVALSGDGGDEIFGGYHEYETAFWTDFYNDKGKLSSLNVVVSKILYKAGLSKKNLGSYLTFKNFNSIQKINRGMGFSQIEKKALYVHNNLAKVINFSDNFLLDIWNKTSKGNNFVNTIFDISIDTRLQNDYLVKVDRASMLNSVEVRSPFLDYDLANFVSKIDQNILLKNGHTKYLLKMLAKKYFDPDIFNRKKQGFGIPIKYWINNELKFLVDEYLSKERIEKRGLFDYQFIKKMIDDHSVSLAHSHKIWALITLEIWFENN